MLFQVTSQQHFYSHPMGNTQGPTVVTSVGIIRHSGLRWVTTSATGLLTVLLGKSISPSQPFSIFTSQEQLNTSLSCHSLKKKLHQNKPALAATQGDTPQHNDKLYTIDTSTNQISMSYISNIPYIYMGTLKLIRVSISTTTQYVRFVMLSPLPGSHV